MAFAGAAASLVCAKALAKQLNPIKSPRTIPSERFRISKPLPCVGARLFKDCFGQNYTLRVKGFERTFLGSPLDNLSFRLQTNIMNSFLKRLFLADFWKGMILTFRTQNPKNIYTEQYPQERPMVAERYRGAPRLNMNPETGETLCIACNLCALACPENLIVVGWHRDDATRRKVLTNFTYDTSRCMFCGLCEDACPTDCLELTQDFEMASYSREGAIWDRHRLEEGPTPARYTR